LPVLHAHGVLCSISTDDPAMFDTDLSKDYAAATAFGIAPRTFYEAGVEGAVCDEETRARLRAIGEAYEWTS
jgi:aminodeoxyfutalosine deaminase